VSIFEPNLNLLRQTFGNSVQNCGVELIRMVLGWRRVYRVTLSRQGHSTPESIIIKALDTDGPVTALESERELRFYQIIYPQLSLPKPRLYDLFTDQATGSHVIMMEDLALTRQLPSFPHQWSRAELKCVLHTYACLHTSPFDSLAYAWLAPRHESFLNFELIPEQVATVQRAGIWGDIPNLSRLISYVRESCERYADESINLLHGDTTPMNAFLPKPLDSKLATLIDWVDVGIGMPEFDLAYMDLQPFECARLIPRSDLLDLYWCYRAEIDAHIPSPEERHARQLHADIVTALWLTATASRVALHPFPEGTYPQIHWASQFGIVYNRLKTMVQEINEKP
jgi:aminoglycoside phosphotransferase (APT) family kinase protein